MMKYAAYVAAARFFSLSPQTRKIYRILGNIVLERQRVQSGLPERYVDRARYLLEVSEKYCMLRDGARVLEVGTGWVHWEGMILRLLYEVEVILFDMWDNRLWKAFQQYFSLFANQMNQALKMSLAQRERACQLLAIINRAQSFEEVYARTGAKYVIDPQGTLRQFGDDSVDMIVSCDVYEHIDRNILPDVMRDSYRVLKPGGYMVHQIDLSDHFWYFVPSISRKQYYRYSDATWKRYFENIVQYFNRVQRPEWLQLFRDAGFDLVEEQAVSEPVARLNLHTKYRLLSQQDVECMVMRVVYRKPAGKNSPASRAG